MKTLTILGAVVAALLIIGTIDAKHPAHAGKPQPSGTIAIAAGYTPALGQDLLFDYTVSDIGNQNPRIQVLCYQDGVLVYGEARNASPDSGAGPAQPFSPLGGGSSDWLTNGGPAECEATLYFWDFHPVQTFVPLASISFHADG